MPDKSKEGGQPKRRDPSSSRSSAKGAARSRTIKFLAAGVALAAVIGLAYGFGLLGHILPQRDSSISDQKLGQAFSKLPGDNLFSSNNLLQGIGKSPADAAPTLPSSTGESLVPEAEKKPQSSPSDQDGGPASQLRKEALPLPQGGSTTREPGPLSSVAPRAVETPIIVTREPPEASASTGKKPEGSISEQPPAPAEAAPDRISPPIGRKQKTGVSPNLMKEPPAATAPASKASDSGDRTKPEQFQLPGSLLVKIHNYSGTAVKWGLMVILDDSAAMARKVKPWTPNRVQAAENFIGRLSGALTPGSKIAVRDFLCKKSDTSKKAAESPCLSHLLYDWAESPFNGLKEKLQQTSPQGQNNPCAAAAYSLKRDFSGTGNLTPRIVLVTNGAVKCNFSEVFKAIDQNAAKEKIVVDVLALGMGRKKQSSYSKLVKKANGVFLNVDKPSDMEPALSRYGKILKTRTMEKIEVRGEKTVLSMNPEDEITLAPGNYTVVLPVVAGLVPAKRTIENVKIISGQTHVLDVSVKKGRPIVRAGKK